MKTATENKECRGQKYIACANAPPMVCKSQFNRKCMTEGVKEKIYVLLILQKRF